jgi:hypothetical protein
MNQAPRRWFVRAQGGPQTGHLETAQTLEMNWVYLIYISLTSILFVGNYFPIYGLFHIHTYIYAYLEYLTMIDFNRFLRQNEQDRNINPLASSQFALLMKANICVTHNLIPNTPCLRLKRTTLNSSKNQPFDPDIPIFCYPLVNYHSYWKWPFLVIVDLPI